MKVNGKSTPGKVLGETILTFTIEPLTQQELDRRLEILRSLGLEASVG